MFNSVRAGILACALMSTVFCLVQTAFAQGSSQLPEVGTDQQVFDAVQTIWQIRKSKKWNDPLTSQELAAVRLGMDAHDSMLLQDASWASAEVLRLITLQLTGNIEQLRGVETRITGSLEMVAYFDPASNKIEIPVGLLSAMYWTQWAKEEAKVNPTLLPYLSEYLFLLSRNKFQRTSTTGSTVIRLSEYVNGKPWRPDNVVTNKTEASVRKAMLDSITFIIGHEACHASLGHKLESATLISVQQEWRADHCSRQIIEGWHPGRTDPFLVLQVLALNALDDQRKPKISKSHPAAICRIIFQAEAFPSANEANSRALLFFPELFKITNISALNERAKFDAEALSQMKRTCGLT